MSCASYITSNIIVFLEQAIPKDFRKICCQFFRTTCSLYFTDPNSDVINENFFSPKHGRVTYHLKALDMLIKIYDRAMGSKSSGKELLSKNGIKSCISIIGTALLQRSHNIVMSDYNIKSLFNWCHICDDCITHSIALFLGWYDQGRVSR